MMTREEKHEWRESLDIGDKVALMTMGRNEALSNLMSMRNLMPDGFVFDREKVNERGCY